ncbi:MAG: TIGR03013 family XrtA/PEP-CTERM system glycosyltransferase [Burkholderiales bacterium]
MIRIFGHYVAKPMLLLVFLEALILLVPVSYADASRFGGAIVFAVVMMVTMAFFDLYEWRSLDRSKTVARRLITSFVVGFVLAGLVLGLLYWWAIKSDSTPGLNPASSWWSEIKVLMENNAPYFAAALAVLFGVHLGFIKWAGSAVLKHRVLVLGTGTRAQKFAKSASESGIRGRVNIVGYLPLHVDNHFVPQSDILLDKGSLPDIVKKYRVDEIVVAVRNRRAGRLPLKELLQCRLMGVPVHEVSTFFERQSGHIHLDCLNDSWLIFSDGFRQGKLRDNTKRILDLSVSAALFLLALPVIILTALAIWLESGGPVLYRQERVGQGGRVFTIFKFRSMRVDAEADGKAKWAMQDDGRVTRVGRIIRKLRIDELPQLYNVLVGDMSFVGPRPERSVFVEQLVEQIPYYNARHSVKPGITGWAQVRYSYGACLEDAVEKLQYDLYYVKNHNLFLDLMVLLDTVRVVICAKGAR